MPVDSAVSLPTNCRLCPRRCGANRAAGERGVCGAADELRVARAALHEWEEPVISVGAGSGTVFFSGCPLRCVYCQNAEISMGFQGIDISLERLVQIFLELQDGKRAANINLVTPTHYAPWIIAAVKAARERGLHVPIVYNTSGYETAESIRALAGTVDVYLADFKYAPDSVSDAGRTYSHAPDYHDEALATLDAMVEQVGAPVFGEHRWVDEAGEEQADPVLVKGVVVRHLVMPGRLDDSQYVIRELWERYGDRVLYSFMSQYTPMREFPRLPELNRPTSAEEYEALLDFADELGIEDYFWQDGEAALESFIPTWNGEGVRQD
ncbi:MAG: radical SAM protein [Coriobacteriia bacterium]|nr:radical SAM protein [Coriobacteriia bacterium]